MFQNLSLKGFTWPREPVLYITLIAAVLNVVAQVLVGEVTWVIGLETVVTLILGFIARSQVSPVQ